jgi:hypothetical protein
MANSDGSLASACGLKKTGSITKRPTPRSAAFARKPGAPARASLAKAVSMPRSLHALKRGSTSRSCS